MLGVVMKLEFPSPPSPRHPPASWGEVVVYKPSITRSTPPHPRRESLSASLLSFLPPWTYLLAHIPRASPCTTTTRTSSSPQ